MDHAVSRTEKHGIGICAHAAGDEAAVVIIPRQEIQLRRPIAIGHPDAGTPAQFAIAQRPRFYQTVDIGDEQRVIDQRRAQPRVALPLPLPHLHGPQLPKLPLRLKNHERHGF